ncbi:MAG: thioredoxin domain-containing protein [Erythrobacter sp.]|jgi:protein-disulfide isomerase|nr:thioredoxin domain-containing protein [Erythrobacter sp.]
MMHRPARRPFVLALGAALSLTLAACSETESAEGGAAGEPIAAIPAPEGTSWLDTATVTPEGGYVVGNPDAPLKLVEYASHTCGACAMFATEGKPALKEEYIASGRVSLEQREVFLNTFDVVIATLAQCGPTERMQPLSDEVWGNLQGVMEGIQANQAAMEQAAQLPLDQRFVGVAQATGLIDFFAARGLPADQARECLSDSAAIEQMVSRAEREAQAAGVTGTPTFVLNGRKLDATQWGGVEPALQRAGAR